MTSILFGRICLIVWYLKFWRILLSKAVILNLFQDHLKNGSNLIQEMLTCVSMTACFFRHPELVYVILNSFQDHLFNVFFVSPGDADMRQHDSSGMTALVVILNLVSVILNLFSSS